MALPIILAGVQLAAKFAPDIIKLFAGDKAGETAESVMRVAERITGKSDEQQAMEALSASPDAALAFQVALLNDKYVAEQMRLGDIANARETYSKHHQATDETAKLIMKYNHVICCVIGFLTVSAVYLLRDNASLGAIAASIGTAVIKDLMTERQQVCGFRFGSSVGSKMKG